MKLLRWDGCFTVAMAHWESISHLYPERKRNILGSTNLAYSEKSIYKFLYGFLSRPSFVPWKRKISKMHLLCTYFAYLPSFWPKNGNFVIFMHFLGILTKLFLTTCRLIWEALEFDRKNYDLYQPLTIILTDVRHI